MLELIFCSIHKKRAKCEKMNRSLFKLKALIIDVLNLSINHGILEYSLELPLSQVYFHVVPYDKKELEFKIFLIAKR